MGREIRRVPPDWQHPKQECAHLPTCQECYQPLHDQDYATAAHEWLTGLLDWEADKDGERSRADVRYYWDWAGGPPDEEYYRPAWTAELATHYQVYETVSEGTPVTPHFATKDDLVDYLVKHGDFWDQRRGHGGWPRANAERFVESEWAPSAIAVVGPSGTKFLAPRDGAA